MIDNELLKHKWHLIGMIKSLKIIEKEIDILLEKYEKNLKELNKK